jgi:hypothetical protein
MCKCLPLNWAKTFYFLEIKEAVAVPDIVIFANFCRRIQEVVSQINSKMQHGINT